MDETTRGWRRRRLLPLAGVFAAPGFISETFAAQAPTGWLQPRLSPPPLRLVVADGRKVPIAAALAGKATAVQLMFTGCSSTCPPQGAFFASLAARIGNVDTRLLSISIDALGDTPSKVSAWQARFGKADAWRGAVADVADAERLTDFLKGTVGKGGTHTGQVFLFDRTGRLAYRTADLPSVDEVERRLAQVAQLT